MLTLNKVYSSESFTSWTVCKPEQHNFPDRLIHLFFIYWSSCDLDFRWNLWHLDLQTLLIMLLFSIAVSLIRSFFPHSCWEVKMATLRLTRRRNIFLQINHNWRSILHPNTIPEPKGTVIIQVICYIHSVYNLYLFELQFGNARISFSQERYSESDFSRWKTRWSSNYKSFRF